ncbi:uncharacterized protein PHALS_02651 [Plasmopara halstedii]|uniref:Uncharacterized protein n=1 Tax=Plasmopara halstedii TaxID=4781 RepID=A0A0P1AZG2_PLAHL|nr:uncharacterized protein PHALS_02651 [Plasmopara halstedii]CEG46237.1 hypothetical protein PHALS_02651 [Plasmopara halstedii]|eukprot:XP_024582606.1 hypothetical protein PHALS_02651 [Plasmopara halstedii]
MTGDAKREIEFSFIPGMTAVFRATGIKLMRVGCSVFEPEATRTSKTSTCDKFDPVDLI